MKLCVKCKQFLEINDFTKNASKPDGLSHHCKSCKRDYQRKWYEAHKEEHYGRTRAYQQALRDTVAEMKNVPCSDCGNRYPHYVMDFDHLPGYDKIDHVSTMVAQGKSIKTIKDEIAKCEVVCANCHRERTFGSRVRSSEVEQSPLKGWVEIS